jgi:hypothetical protein
MVTANTHVTQPLCKLVVTHLLASGVMSNANSINKNNALYIPQLCQAGGQERAAAVAS